MTTAAHRPATLEDVARVAGVSRSTASRVIAGTGFASPAARKQVTAAVDQLGYVPNPAARALVRGGGGAYEWSWPCWAPAPRCWTTRT